MTLTLQQVNDTILTPALASLPPSMDSPKARLMLLAIGLQESRFEHRRQLGNGPARGFWQFERGGGVKGVLNHPQSRKYMLAVCLRQGIPATAQDVWEALENNDYLAAYAARLLLWTDLKPLPEPSDAEGAWALYMRVWRPGKPHEETWDRFHTVAREVLGC